MRRPRTMEEWIIFVTLALLGLTVGLLWTSSIVNRNLRIEIEEIQQQEPTGTGGAEIVPPTFKREANWLFPLAPGDFMQYTSPFGYRPSPFLGIEVDHQGVDIAGIWVARVVAVADGVIPPEGHWPPPGTPYPGGGAYAGHPTKGGYIEILHDNGMVSQYSHLSSTRVHTGDRVVAGQVIGRIGNTGKSDGQHLHFSVALPDGTLTNPLLYIADPEEE